MLQDGDDPGVAGLVRNLSTTLFGGAQPLARGFVHWQRPRVPELAEKQVRAGNGGSGGV